MKMKINIAMYNFYCTKPAQNLHKISKKPIG